MDLMGQMINKTCIKRLQVDHMGYTQFMCFTSIYTLWLWAQGWKWI